MSILMEFSQDELEKEIFTLHEVSKSQVKPKSKKSSSKDEKDPSKQQEKR